MSGRKSRDKGKRAELEVVHAFLDAGISSERVPLSGAMGSYVGDVSAAILGRDRIFEVKCRATGFRQLYQWLAGHYGLVVRADREEPLAVVRLRDLAELAIAADKKRVSE